MTRKLVMIGVFVVLLGCGSKEAEPEEKPNIKRGVGAMVPAVKRAGTKVDLSQLGQLYMIKLTDGDRPPMKLEDWPELKKDYPQGYQALADGTYIFLWNAGPTSMPAGTSNTIVAYEKSVPENKGEVLMGDGSVQTMTAAEFKKAPKAGK